jgi:drug/metabolite transporter (DMT)-like permease
MRRAAGNRSSAPLAALLAGALCIALSPIWVRVSETGVTASAFWRVALAVPVLWILVIASPRERQGTRARAWPLLIAAGFAFAGDLGFWHSSIRLTTVANATLLANLASLFVTLALWLFWRERPSALFLAGLATALGGVVMLVGSSLRFSASGLVGDALGIVTALFYAAYLIAVKQLRGRGVGVLWLMAVTSSVTALALLPAAIASGDVLLPQTASGWSILLGLALISHAAGQGLIAYALAHLPASFSAVSLLLQPVLAALFAWTLLGEALGVMQLAGGVVVLTGIALAQRASLGAAR